MSSVAEHLGRESRHKLFMLIYRAVQESTDQEREISKKKGKRLGKGRPPYVSKTAALLGVSRETASNWKNRKYQAMNPNAEILVETAWRLNPEETMKILLADLTSHRQKLEKFLGGARG